jgi:hypothetical protein
MRLVALVLLVSALGCASAPIKKADLAAIAHADARVLEGCYDCLVEARAIYDRVAVGKARPLLIARVFETQLLIALREKELAIDNTAARDRAHALASELPPAAEAARYLRVIDAVPPDFVGTPRVEARQFRDAQNAMVSSVGGELAWLKNSSGLREPVRQYLSIALDCATLGRPGRPVGPATLTDDPWTGSVRAKELPPEVAPLVAYRAAVCDGVSRKTLERLRAAVPQFVETDFFLARLEVVSAIASKESTLTIDIGLGSAKARALLTGVVTRFPQSASAAYLSGTFNQIAGDCRAAVDFYDKTLALKSLHEDALLGRTACLSFLKRPDEAIATATRMIELQTDNWGSAFYWRAFNRHARQELDQARADVERAKTLAPSEQTSTLAGIIEHDQDALAIAETDLKRAKAQNRQNRNCTAMWYLALVKLKQELWLDSASHFEDAMGCYAANAKDFELGRRAMEARTDLEPDFKAAQLAGFDVALKEALSQQHAAAFNAANQNAHGGNFEKARGLIEIAAQDPSLADKVMELREIIK